MFTDSLAYKISAFNRNRKWGEFVKTIKFNSKTKVLDVGYCDQEYSLTDNYIQKHYPYPENITALGIEEPVEFSRKYPLVKVIRYDGSNFPFEDKTYDVCWSNAVIEHVGSRENQLKFISEISRTARTAFITTPNRNFPFEVHTRVLLLHFLPKRIFDRFLKLIGKKWATGSYMNLLSLKDIVKLLNDAGIRQYRIIKNKLMFFTLDYIIMWNDYSY